MTGTRKEQDARFVDRVHTDGSQRGRRSGGIGIVVCCCCCSRQFGSPTVDAGVVDPLVNHSIPFGGTSNETSRAVRSQRIVRAKSGDPHVVPDRRPRRREDLFLGRIGVHYYGFEPTATGMRESFLGAQDAPAQILVVLESLVPGIDDCCCRFPPFLVVRRPAVGGPRYRLLVATASRVAANHAASETGPRPRHRRPR